MLTSFFSGRLKVATICATTLVFSILLVAPATAKGFFGGGENSQPTNEQIQAQLYQISQQLTQLQAQMTQLQLQMNQQMRQAPRVEQRPPRVHVSESNSAPRVEPRQALEEKPSEQSLESHTRPLLESKAPLETTPLASERIETRAQPIKRHQQTETFETSHHSPAVTPSHAHELASRQVQPAKPVEKPVLAKPAEAPKAVAKTESKTEKEKSVAPEKAQESQSTMLPGVLEKRLARAKKKADAEKETVTSHPGALPFSAPPVARAPEPAKAANASPNKPRVRASVHIKAPPEVVWHAVHEERKTDPDLAYSKILRQSGNESTMEQKFVLIPVIGAATCVMNTTEIPNQRIDYHLVKSDRFKAMEGSWVLTPSADGKSTTLELSSHIDMGLPVPRMMLNNIAEKKLQRRVNHVKQMAESHSKVAQKGSMQ